MNYLRSVTANQIRAIQLNNRDIHELLQFVKGRGYKVELGKGNTEGSFAIIQNQASCVMLRHGDWLVDDGAGYLHAYDGDEFKERFEPCE